MTPHFAAAYGARNGNPRRPAADERATEPRRELQPAEQVAQRPRARTELEPVRVAPGEHELERACRLTERDGVEARPTAEKARLEREAIDRECACMPGDLEYAPVDASRRLYLAGAKPAEQTVVGVAVNPDPQAHGRLGA